MSYPDTPFQRRLAELAACSDARKWISTRTAQGVWDETDRGDWMVWWLDDAEHGPEGWQGAIASAWAEYRKACAPALAKYNKAIASALAECCKAITPALAKYNKAIAPARATLANAIRAIYPTIPNG